MASVHMVRAWNYACPVRRQKALHEARRIEMGDIVESLRAAQAVARAARREALARIVLGHVTCLTSDPLGTRQPPEFYERYYGVAEAILTMLDRGEPQL